MDQVRDALRSTAVRVTAAAMLLLGVFTITPMLSGAASAHRASIDAEVSCDGTVEWTATSWSKDDDGTNDDVRVYRSSDGGDDQEVGHGSFSGDDGYSFSGHFSWPSGATTITVSTDPKGQWGNGEAADDEGHDEMELEQPDCEDGGHVDHEQKCDDTAPGYGDGEVTLTLSNPAGPFAHDAEFDVYEPDQDDAHQTYTVPAGGQQTVSYDGLSDGHHHIKVMEDDKDESRDVEVDCDQEVPSVTASQACVGGDGSITVNLSNTGGETVTFTVKDPVTHTTENVQVAPNQSASRTFSGLADGEYTVGVMVGKVDLSQHFEVDCDTVKPPHHDNECPDDGSTTTTVEDHDTSTTDHEASSTSEHASSSTEHESSSTSEHAPSSTEHEASSTSNKPYSRTTATSSVTTTTAGEEGAYSTSTTVDHGDDHEDDGHDSTSTSVHDGDDDEHDCEPVGEGSIQVAKVCVANDGQVTVTLIATGDTVTFVVEGAVHVVQPGAPQQVVIGGLADGTHTIHVKAGKQDLSFTVDIACDLSPRVTVSQECSAFDGTVTFLLENLGDDHDATFTIDGTDHVVAPGGSTTVTIDGLADGEHSFTVSINGVAMPDATVTIDCNPTFDIVAQCDTVSASGTPEVFWFTVTNTEAVDVTVTWDGGSATVPAGESRTVGSVTSPLQLRVDGEVVATAVATDVICSRTVTVDKELIGAPPTPETYAVTISRLVGDTFVPVTTVPLVAGQPTTVTLPSTLDPAGIQYQVEETDQGSANTSIVSPSQLTLSGHLGETVSVVVTNGYASVQIDKSVSADVIGLGEDLTYTLQGTNTGGLTLEQVVVADRLPAGVALVSATVAGNGGTCSLTASTRPQVISCALTASLAAGQQTPVITVVVTVDDDAALVGGDLVNQAKIVGVFADGASPGPAPRQDTALSCEPVLDGTVCDLSAAVSTSVIDSEPPVTTTTTPGTTTTTVEVLPPTTTAPPTGPLPHGGSDPLPLLVLGLGALGLGGVLLYGRRRA